MMTNEEKLIMKINMQRRLNRAAFNSVEHAIELIREGERERAVRLLEHVMKNLDLMDEDAFL